MLTKNTQRIAAIVIFAVLIIAVIGSIISGIVNRQETNLNFYTDSTPAPPSAKELYEQAISSITGLTELALSVKESTTTTLDNGIFSEQAERSVQYTGLGTESMSALTDETISIGNYQIPYSVYYNNGKMYLTVGGGKFCVPISASAFSDQMIPAVCFDVSLYQNIEAEQIDDNTIISFHSPSAAEKRLLPQGAVFTEASGQAILDSNLQLTTSIYDIAYSIGSVQIEKHIEISTRTDPVSIVPPSTEAFLEVQNINAPIALEKSCGYLMQAQLITANIQDTIICDAFGDDRSQAISLDMYGEGSDFAAKVDVSVLHTSSSRGGEQLRRTENILYRNGNCTITVDGSPSQGNTTITAQDIRVNCQDLLLSTILLPQYIAGISLTETEDAYRYDFSAVPALANTMCKNACDTLYKDPELLFNLSEESTTTNLGAYLQIQKFTGLPTASGIFYTGNFTIEGHPYMLKYETSQTYCAVSDTASSAITE